MKAVQTALNEREYKQFISKAQQLRMSEYEFAKTLILTGINDPDKLAMIKLKQILTDFFTLP